VAWSLPFCLFAWSGLAYVVHIGSVVGAANAAYHAACISGIFSADLALLEYARFIFLA
jgi:hypothetical protein